MSWRKKFGFNSKLITSKKLNPTLSWAYSRSGWLVQLNCETPSLPLNLWKWVSVRFSRVKLAVDINCTILNLIISSNWWFSRGESFSTSFLTLSLSLWVVICMRKALCAKKRQTTIIHQPQTENRFPSDRLWIEGKVFLRRAKFLNSFRFFLLLPISVPPKITHVTSGGHLQVRKGSPVRLECSATGNPMPNITWTRKNNLLPNGKGVWEDFWVEFVSELFFCVYLTLTGEEQFTSSVYVIENMDRHKGGTYICTANNGVGQVATSQIILHVLCEYFGSLYDLHYLYFIFLNIESCSL